MSEHDDSETTWPQALVREHSGAIAAEWVAACPELTSERAAQAVDVVCDALHGCGAPNGPHLHEGVHDLFQAAEDHLKLLTPTSVSRLRDAVRHQVLDGLPPLEALEALHCVSAVVDALLEQVAAWTSERLDALAYVDGLTGLGNRRAADDNLAASFAAAARHDRPLTAVVIDLDGLKRINDGEGHEAGDGALRALADALRAGLRTEDRLYRIGGDEFLVLLPDAVPDGIDAAMERVRLAGAPSFSYGAATAPAEAATSAALVRLADERLLEGRRVRRAGVTPGMRSPRRVLQAAAIVVGFGMAAAGMVHALQGSASPPTQDASSSTALPSITATSFGAGRLQGLLPPAQRPLRTTPPTTAVPPRARATAPAPRQAGGATVGAPASGATEPAPAATPSPTTTTTTAPPPHEDERTPPSTVPGSSSTPKAVEPTPTSAPSDDPPVVRDDEYRFMKATRDLRVLDNDDPGASDFDLGTLQVVVQPERGTVEVVDGALRYHADHVRPVRFRYRICTRSGDCGEAWVSIKPGRDSTSSSSSW